MKILIVHAIVITVLYIRKNESNKTNYSNYQNCLRALAENDPELKKYIENK